MEHAMLKRLKSHATLVFFTFVLSLGAIAAVVFMGWADEPLNAWIESNARSDMGWLDRTLHDLSGPSNIMAEARRHDFELVTKFSFWIGVSGAAMLTVAVIICDLLFGWTKPRS